MNTSFYFEEEEKFYSKKKVKWRIFMFVLLVLLNLFLAFSIGQDYFINNTLDKKEVVIFCIILLQILFRYKNVLFPRNKGVNKILLNEEKIDFVLFDTAWVLYWKDVEKIQMNFGSVRFFFDSNQYRSIEQINLNKEQILTLRKVVNTIATIKNIEIQIPQIIQENLFTTEKEEV